MNRIALVFLSIVLCFMASCTSSNANKEYVSSSNLYRILVADKYGFMDENGKIVIEPQFEWAYLFSEGVCFARIGERRGLIDSTGTFTMEFGDTIHNVFYFVNGVSKIRCGLNNNIGVINKEGKTVIPAAQHTVSIEKDNDSVYIVVDESYSLFITNKITGDTKEIGIDRWKLTNKDGKAIGDTYDEILVGFRNGLCAVKLNDKWGYINWNGDLVIDTIYDFARVFSKEGIARVRQGNEHFFIDKSGNKLFSVDGTITGFTCNRAAVVLNGENCFVDTKGTKVFSVDADIIYPFNEKDKMATIVKNGQASKIDTMGNVVLRTNYEDIGAFIDGVAPVKKNDKWGYIDTTGNEIITVTNENYLYALHDKSSKIRAVLNTINGIECLTYYDLQGNLIWKDTPNGEKKLPANPERKDFVEYFDARMAELDPIEGVYYVTINDYYQDRENPNIIGSNGSESYFFAVVRDGRIEGFRTYFLDGSNQYWANKFVRIGESNDYAILKLDKDNDYSSEGRMTLDDPTCFEFRLEQGHNAWNNFFVTYEFVRDYPPMSDYEKFQKPEWSGTGFAIAEGFIVTNYHVTRGAKNIRIKGIGGNMKESCKGFVVASDKEHDLSIIKVVDKDFESLGSIPYGIGKVAVDVGDEVFVLGYPMTQSMGEEVKLTEGIISAASGYKGDVSMYQITAAVQPGNSGGPLFNSDGTVIGIVRAKHTNTENANYAVKVSYLYSLITSSDLGIDITGKNRIHSKKLSKKVKEIKDYVYLIECSSK